MSCPVESHGDGEVADQAREHQQRSLQTVGVLDAVQDRVAGRGGQLRELGIDVCRTPAAARPG